MRPEQGWSSRSGRAEAGGGGRDPRCPRERYRGIRPAIAKILQKKFSAIYLVSRDGIDSGGRSRSNPATSYVPIPRRTRELAECAPGQRAVA